MKNEKRRQFGRGSTTLSVRISVSQFELLCKCAQMAGQNKAELVREALAGFLPPLYKDLQKYQK